MKNRNENRNENKNENRNQGRMKMNRKRVLSGLLALLLLLCTVFGTASCAGGSGESGESGTASDTVPAGAPTDGAGTVRIATLNGPTTISVLHLLEDSRAGKTKNTYVSEQIYATADAFAPALLKGDLDAAILPANAAAALYQNSGGKLRIAAVNNLGVLGILEKGDSVHSLSDLRGKTVVTIGAGTTTQAALEYLLKQNGLVPGRDVTVEYKSEAAEVLASVKKGLCDIVMLPQPAATAAQNAVEGLRYAIDINEAWNALPGDSLLVTGVLTVNTAFAEAHPDTVAILLEEYRESIEKTSDTDATAALAVSYGIAGLTTAEAAKTAIPLCNLRYMDGEDMKQALTAYYAVLYESDPSLIGGELPPDGIYDMGK